MEKSRKQLEQENADLQLRLQEAEETLEAIRSGGVDAIVVSRGQQEQVFTLQGADSAYRVILENMSEGAATLSADGTIVYCNARLAEILSLPLDQVMGTRIEQYVLPGDRATFSAMLVQAALDESRGEVRFQRSDLTAVPMYVSLNALPASQMVTITMVATDLTEQKRHQEVLAAEELARSILEQATEPIIVCDAEGIIIRASHAAHELCGSNPILQSFHKVFPLRTAERQDPKDQPPPIDTNRLLCVGEIMSGRICRNLEMVFEWEGGQTFDLLVSAGPLVNRQGQNVGCVIGLMDITERKRAAEALASRTEELATTVEEMELIQEEIRTTNDELVAAQESLEAQRQRYLDLFDSAPDGYVVTDPHGIIREANQAAGALLQEKQADLVSKPLLLYVPAAQQEDYQKMLEGLARAEGIQRWEAPLQTRQRTQIDAALTVAVVRDEEGNLESLRWLLRDVSERKRAEEALRESEARFRSVLDNSRDVIYRVNAQTGRYEYISPSAESVAGFSPDELMAMDVETSLAMIHPEDIPAMRAALSRLEETGQGDVEYRQRTKGGDYRWMSNRMSLIKNDAGQVLYRTGNIRDITERKRGEEALAAAQRQVQSIIDNTTAIIYAFDLEKRFVMANTAVAELLNSTPEQMIGKSRHEFMAKEEADWHEANDRKVIEAGGALEFEEYSQLQGRSITWLTTKFPLRDAQGRIYAVAGISTDVSERKKAEEALRESEERLRLAQASAQAGVWDWNPRTGETVFTEENERLYGLAPGTVHTYQDFRQRVHPDDIARMEAERDAAITNRQPFDLEFRIVLESGGSRWVSAKGGAVYDQAGNVTRVFGVNVDITDRKRMEQALRDSERLYRAIGESIDYGVWTCAPDGRNTYASESFLKLVGITQEQCSEFGWGNVLHPDDIEATIAAWKECVRTGGMWYREHRFKGADGQWHPVLACGVPVRNERCEIVQWAGINLDISRIKQAEKQLKDLNETLERRVAERTAEVQWRAGQLQRLASQLTRVEQQERRRLAEILHDHLQQLLVGAKFNLGIMRTQVQDDDLLQSVRQVDELLDESIQASRSLTVELFPPILHSGGLGEALKWLADWKQGKHGLRVRVEADAQANPSDEDIRVLLFQSVRELLLNTVKHAQVKDAVVRMSLHGTDWVQILVSDAGSGFDPKQHLSPEASGGGFGLFSVRERLELLGGRMEIDSAPGQGTRITLLAPLRMSVAGGAPAAQAAMTTGPDADSAARQPRTRVLVADDHTVVRDGLVRLLQMQPELEVVGQAVDGQQAVELVRQLQPDVVIMDVNMPVLNGVEATRQILRESPRIRVIGLSLHTDANLTEPMRQSGAIAYLAKGSSPEELLAAIRECIRNSSN